MKLKVIAENPCQIPKNLQKKWSKKLTEVKVAADKTTIIFIGEILEILSDEKVDFRNAGTVDYDMFSGCDFTWTLTSGKFQITRQLEREISEGWQRVEVNTDKVLVWGLEKYKFSWNGECGNCLSTLVIQMDIKDKTIIGRIIQLGKELFEIFEFK
jgi:hypothetical protein